MMVIHFDRKRILIHRIMKMLKGLELEDVNFVQGVIDGALVEQGIDLADPLAQEIAESVSRRLVG